jgi:hypothetical protein
MQIVENAQHLDAHRVRGERRTHAKFHQCVLECLRKCGHRRGAAAKATRMHFERSQPPVCTQGVGFTAFIGSLLLQCEQDRTETLHDPAPSDDPLDVFDQVCLAFEPGQGERRFQPVEQIAVVEPVGGQVEQAHDGARGARGRKFPAGFVANEDLHAFQQRTHTTRGNPVDRHECNRGRNLRRKQIALARRLQPGYDLIAHGNRLLFECARFEQRRRFGRVGRLDRPCAFRQRCRVDIAAHQLRPGSGEQWMGADCGRNIGPDEMHSDAFGEARQPRVNPGGDGLVCDKDEWAGRGLRAGDQRPQQCRRRTTLPPDSAPELQHQLRLWLHGAHCATMKMSCQACVQPLLERLRAFDGGKSQFIADRVDARREGPKRAGLLPERRSDPFVFAQGREQLDPTLDRIAGWIAGPGWKRRYSRRDKSSVPGGVQARVQCIAQRLRVRPARYDDVYSAQICGRVADRVLAGAQDDIRNRGPKAHIGRNGDFDQ